jgi:hypothetical protein
LSNKNQSAVEHLPSKCEILCSNPGTAKKQKKACVLSQFQVLTEFLPLQEHC